MPAIIRVNSLFKHFGEIKAIEELSFSVEEGDVYGFLGQNGAGKSTTIRMLLGLVRPSHGEIEIMGMNLFEKAGEILRKTGAVIERPDLYRYLSGLENLSLFARLSGFRATRQQLMDQLHLVGLSDRANSKVRTYSQGMKQRLGLAVALVHDPQLIILDEPTNGLDPQGIADIRRLILYLANERGKTVFVSSHLLSEVQVLANRMLILDKGRKLVEGSVGDLMNPSRMVVELQTTNDRETYQRLSLSPWQSFLQAPGRESGILFTLDQKKVPDLVNDLVSMGIGILSIQPRYSLEDYFLSLTSANLNAHVTAN